MKRIAGVLFILLGFYQVAASQNGNKLVISNMNSTGIISTIKQPTVYVGSHETNPYFLILAPDRIEKKEFIAEPEAVKLYGHKGENGVEIITPKAGTLLLKLEDILEYFKVEPGNRHLRVCLDGNLTSKPELILADFTLIEKVEIIDQPRWSFVYDPKRKADEKFINIVTKK